MAYIRILETPKLRDPVLIAAFAGWNDASEVATFAARTLVQQWGARKMAETDPEDFYAFTETRPTVRIAGRRQRHIDWPANDFYFHVDKKGKRDFIILIGVEPQLKWRTFTQAIVDFAGDHDVNILLTLGGLIADVPHTIAPRLSGTSNSPRMTQQLRQLGVEQTRYEGPTGIVGVLNAALAREGCATTSIWGSVPDYLSAAPNVKVSLAILERLNALLRISIELSELQVLADQFDRQVSEALAEHPEVQAYVRELEERDRQGRVDIEGTTHEHETLPSGDALIHELEEYLRRRRHGQGGN